MPVRSDKLVHTILGLLSAQGTASAELDPLVRALTAREVVTLDHQLRRRTFSVPFGCDEWGGSYISDVVRRFDAAKRGTCELCVYACHPSGYIREAAIKAMRSTKDPVVLPFICVRLNDWVPGVWWQAHQIISGFLELEYARSLARLIPILHDRIQGARQDHGPILSQLITLLSQPQAQHTLAELMTGSDSIAARFVLTLVVKDKPADHKAVIQSAWHSRDQILRLLAFPLLRAITTSAQWSEIVAKALVDRSAAIRIRAIRAAAAQRTDALLQAMEERLYDPVPSVRHAARVYLREFKSFDAPTLYRAAIQSRQPARLVGALSGLAESGESSDAQWVLPLIGSSSASVAKAATIALAKLATPDHRDILVNLMQQSHPRLVRTIAAEVAKRLELVEIEDVHTLAAEHQPAHVRVAAVMLINKLDVYDALSMALTLLAQASPESALEKRALNVVAHWSPSFAHRPSALQVRNVQEAFRRVAARVPMACTFREELGRGVFADPR